MAEPHLSPGNSLHQTASVGASDIAAKQAFLWSVHSYLGEYARFADTKAAFLGTLAAGLLSGLFGAKLFDPIMSTSPSHWRPSSWLTVVAACSLSLAIWFAIRTVYPRLRSVPGQGFIFWGNIAGFNRSADFRKAFHAQDAEHLVDVLLDQTFTVAKHVCTPKYRNVSLGLLCFAIGAIFGVLALLLNLKC